MCMISWRRAVVVVGLCGEGRVCLENGRKGKGRFWCGGVWVFGVVGRLRDSWSLEPK